MMLLLEVKSYEESSASLLLRVASSSLQAEATLKYCGLAGGANAFLECSSTSRPSIFFSNHVRTQVRFSYIIFLLSTLKILLSRTVRAVVSLFLPSPLFLLIIYSTLTMLSRRQRHRSMASQSRNRHHFAMLVVLCVL